MRKSIIFTFFCTVMLAVSSASASPYRLMKDQSSVVFSARSTLHGFQGHAGHMQGEAEFEAGTGTLLAPFRITVEVDDLETGNKARDRAMLKMFASEAFPEISWSAESLDCTPFDAGGRADCKASGRLRIRDLDRENDFTVTLKRDEKGIWAEGDLEVSLDDFHLKPPSVLGVVRVFDIVSIHFKSRWLEEKV